MSIRDFIEGLNPHGITHFEAIQPTEFAIKDSPGADVIFLQTFPGVVIKGILEAGVCFVRKDKIGPGMDAALNAAILRNREL